MDEVMRSAFADELNKIAGARDVLGKAIWAGWHGVRPDLSVMPGSGWRAAAKGVGKFLPGGKLLTTAALAGQGAGVLGKTQEGGPGHLERAADFAGSAVGGLAATGLLMGTRFGRMSPTAGMLAGGLGGGYIGGKVLAAPFKAGRKLLRKSSPQQMQPSDDGWRNTAPGGLNTTPDATVGQAQAM